MVQKDVQRLNNQYIKEFSPTSKAEQDEQKSFTNTDDDDDDVADLADE